MLFHFSCNIDRLPTTRFLKIDFSKLWSKDVFQCFGKESSKYQVQQSFKRYSYSVWEDQRMQM